MNYKQLVRQMDGSYTKLGVKANPDILQAIPKAENGASWLDLSAGNGSFALFLHKMGVNVTAFEMSASASIALKATSADRFRVLTSLPWEIEEKFDVISLVLPAERGNELVKVMIETAFRLTKIDGKVYLAGHKQLGFERYFKYALSLFNQGEIIERDQGFRLAELAKTADLNLEKPDLQDFTIDARNKALGFSCWPGVFSAGRLDKASKLLLEYLPNMSGKKVLDLGCGYGALGLFLAAENAEVTMLDDDLLSIDSAKISAQKNHLESNVKFLHSDVDSALFGEVFDLAISNPPFHIGKNVSYDIAFEFINCAKQRAKEIWLVANAALPYEKMFKSVKIAVKSEGFKVLVAN